MINLQSVPKEMVIVEAKHLSIISEKLWQSGEGPTDQIKENYNSFKKRKKKDPRYCRSVSLISVSYKIMGQILLETMLRHRK